VDGNDMHRKAVNLVVDVDDVVAEALATRKTERVVPRRIITLECMSSFLFVLSLGRIFLAIL